MRETGKHQRIEVEGEEVFAFIPHPLPPKNPPLMRRDEETKKWLTRAEETILKLDILCQSSPDLQRLIYGFVRIEAVLSSQISGSTATMGDLFKYEALGSEYERADSLKEVGNLSDTLAFSHAELSSAEAGPLSMALLNRAHGRLMRGAPGLSAPPGRTRRNQNWIGGTRPGNAIFIPPPPRTLPDLLNVFERFIRERDEVPALMRVAMAHVQFDTFHPYLDGNGRIARALITLLMQQWKLLAAPLLSPSLFFRRHRAEYYRRISAVRTEGDWEGWTRFFLEAMATVAGDAYGRCLQIVDTLHQDRARALEAGKSTVSSMRLLEALPERPIVTTAHVIEMLNTTRPTAMKAISTLQQAGILKELTGKKRDRLFGYTRYMQQLAEGVD